MEPAPRPAPLVSSESPAGVTDRLRGVLPLVRGVVGKVRAVGIASAVAAVVLWLVLFGGVLWPLTVRTAGALVALGILLVPAGGTLLAVLTLNEVLDLPNRLRALPGQVRDSATEAATGAADVVRPGESKRSRRLFGFVGVLWRLRGVMGDSRGTFARTVALARAARLASLPFVLVLVAAFALDFVVIAAAVVAVVVAIAL
jgi:hypothetical protein